MIRKPLRIVPDTLLQHVPMTTDISHLGQALQLRVEFNRGIMRYTSRLQHLHCNFYSIPKYLKKWQFQILHCICLDFLVQTTSDFGPIPRRLCEVRQSALIEAIPGGFARSAVKNSL